jgi:asparagine synthase (glutamine-hydrolysing)
MCGIAGAAWTDPRLAVSAETLATMTDLLTHRGPDDQGAHTSQLVVQPPYPSQPGVALGHTRLSVMDVQRSGQPMANEDGTIQLLFNGEIYNYQHLRKRLDGSGHHFRSDGDTEVIIHLYEDEGPEFVHQLVGMFAMAIWDRPQRRLLLARDRMGQKPLLYRVESGRVTFASELKSLLAVPGCPREIDATAIDEYLLYQYVPHPNSIFRGIRKLPPGHLAIYQDGQLSVEQYWQPDFEQELEIEETPAVDRVSHVLSEAVRVRMNSDVPLGAFLSGGVDSSIVVALMQQFSSGPVKTFAVGFPEAEYDESGHARRVAEFLGTEHHELRVEPNCLELLPKLLWHYDEPFADSSAIATYVLAEQTRQHVTVALSGDGGDELFGGYERYLAMQLSGRFDRLPRPLRRILTNSWLQTFRTSGRQKSRLRKIQRLSQVLAVPAARRYADLVGIFNESQRASLYADEFLTNLPENDPVEFLDHALRLGQRRDGTTAATLADLITYLPCDLCQKVDIATMAHGLECRQPMLDHRVVELAAALPIGMKVRRGRGKQILKRAFGKMLPPEVFGRRKMGFGVPLDHWFRHELRELLHDTLLSQRALARPYFRADAIRDLLAQHMNCRFDHASRLWALLVLELWHQQWVDP